MPTALPCPSSGSTQILLGGHGLPEYLQERLEVAPLGADVSDRGAERVAARLHKPRCSGLACARR
jgi:hypothetical protein